MSGSLAWRIRGVLGQPARQKVRRVVDPLLRSVGSVGSIATPTRRVALTFDDGPDPRWTPELLDVLARVGATATFFVLTERARQHRNIVSRIQEGGHEIALHGEDHTRLTTLPLREARRQIVTSHAELEQLAGCRVRWFRPPYGAQNLGTYGATRADGLEVVVWGPAARDWEEGTEHEVADRAMVGMHPGSVVLLHDGLWLPADQHFPTFDRTAVFARLLEQMATQSFSGSSIEDVLRDGRLRRTAWFRP